MRMSKKLTGLVLTFACALAFSSGGSGSGSGGGNSGGPIVVAAATAAAEIAVAMETPSVPRQMAPIPVARARVKIKPAIRVALRILIKPATRMQAAADNRKLNSLKTVPVPGPTAAELNDLVRDKAAAIALGKAFFWEMQFGSDG